MADAAGRPLLPYSNQQAFKFANATPAEPREGQKNYVFVNEHDRQKRLKVMRACEACRKRKIKCDAVTTNSWPCSKCQRSNLECVPPSTDGAVALDGSYIDTSVGDYDTTATTQPMPQQDGRYGWASANTSPVHGRGTMEYGFPNMAPASAHPSSVPTAQFPPASFDRVYPDSFQEPISSTEFGSYSTFSQTRGESAPLASSVSEDAWRGSSPEQDLSGALGDLKINNAAIAPYIANQKTLAEGPAVEESEPPLPPLVGKGSTVKIPEEMMPSDEQATKYFEYYFTNVHPYVPVINRSYFGSQWKSNRDSISPLILESIFASASSLLGQPAEAARWHALANRHEESFKDVPRLSTLQGMLILLKAREAVPKRGYYYRSWMSVVNMVAMAKDLGLQDHYEDHQMGRGCDRHDQNCAIKTRIWHTLFQLEIMIGGPQGRTEFSVSPDSVDFAAPRTGQGLDGSELQIFQDHTQFMKIAANIRESNQIYGRLRKKTAEWASDQSFLKHGESYDKWPQELPAHLRITYPADGSAPWIPFHVVGNMHTQHWLGILMHHRPILENATAGFDEAWKQEEMKICYEASTKICRLQEAVVGRFGLEGLIVMQRGINFTIYSVLTCTMLHLVAMTSPDPELYSGAADFFTRHMRILEKCMDAWPMPEMQRQIDSIRQAFSADTNKPFELKAHFPYNSPGRSSGTPPSDAGYPPEYSTTQDARIPGGYHAALTPPTPVHNTLPADYGQTYPMVAGGGGGGGGGDMPQAQIMQAQWNPSRIFDQWNTAFSFSPQSQTSQASVQQTPTAAPAQLPVDPLYNGGASQATPSDATWASYQLNLANAQSVGMTSVPPQTYSSAPSARPEFDAQLQNFISPAMWQEAVLGSFPEGSKRRKFSSISGPAKRVK